MITPFTKDQLDAFIEEWCQRLESGEERQTIEALENTDGRCCLGVSCYLLKDRLGLEYAPECNIAGESAFNGERYLLPSEVYEALGMMNHGSFVDAKGDGILITIKGRTREIQGSSLTQLNDAGVTFPQIAKIIRENKHLLFELYREAA
jgi:hypothetical protein